VHCDVIRLVALDLILWFVVASVNRVSLKLDRGGDHSNDRTVDAAGLRIPTHVVALAESALRHLFIPSPSLQNVIPNCAGTGPPAALFMIFAKAWLMAPTLFTLGHGTATAEELAWLIREAAIESIVDVRSVPKSRRHPHFWREEMERWIPEKSGSTYRWEPALGGFRSVHPGSPNVALRHPSFRAYADYMETDGFAVALNDLLVRVATSQVAIMCSETLWWRCHRRLISDAALLLHAVPVQHLMHDGKLRPHILTAGVRVTPKRTLRYDVLFESDDATER